MNHDLLVDNATGYVIELEHDDVFGWEYNVRLAGRFLSNRVGYPTREDALEAAQKWAKKHKEQHGV